jgi:acyl CoA:acetate/3-ketoacid CoA transferase
MTMQASSTPSMVIPLRSPDSGKIASAEEAARLVRDGDTVATGGFVGIGFAEEIAVALRPLFVEDEQIEATGKPRTTLIMRPARVTVRAWAQPFAMKDWCGVIGALGPVPKLQRPLSLTG